ncbi:MAG: aminopeptidase [Nevskiales bacterium]|nr:aminopeptidase [Nevskiales bacterium]
MELVKLTLRGLAVVGLGVLLGGCSRIGYYAHLAGGQMELLGARRPIDSLLHEPGVDPALKQRLGKVRDARQWAVSHLLLPDNGSYRSYADLGRRYVVWNVFATPEFSLEPVESCFLIVGCLAYQGYYQRDRAQVRADELAARGDDVYVGGVPAYSTLGWFDDPLTNTMMQWSDAALIGTLFHELAHQKLYVKNDTRFNESFAEFVEDEGLRQYLAAFPAVATLDADARSRQQQFVKLIVATRERLAALYQRPLSPAAMRSGKAAVFADLEARYARMRDTQWQGDRRYDGWFEDGELNNAKLLPFGLYDEYLPAFAALYAESGRDWGRFYAAAQRLAGRAPAARQAELDRLLEAGRAASAPSS